MTRFDPTEPRPPIRTAALPSVAYLLLAAVVLAGVAAFLLAAPPAAGEAFRVSGAVIDEVGQPVAGVRVELLPDVSAFDHQLLQLGGAEGPEPAAEARTDAEGRFELTAPEPGFWVLRARQGDRVVIRAPLAPLAPLLTAQELRPLELPPGPGVAVRVRDAAGEPVHGAWVGAVPAPRWGGRAARPVEGRAWVRWARTGRDGWARVPRIRPGRLHVEALAPGHALAAGETLGSTLELRLEPGVEREVRVLRPDGTAAGGTVVGLGLLGLPAARTGEDGIARVRADSSGEALVHARLPSGNWIAQRLPEPVPPEVAEAAPQATVDAPPAAAEALDRTGTAARSQVEIRFPPVRPVEVRVHDLETGRPLAGALVWSSSVPEVQARADARGIARLRLPDFTAWLPGHSRFVSAAARGYLSGGILVSGPGGQADAPAAPLEISLTAARQQRGRVLDVSGEPVAGARISTWPESFTEYFRQVSRTAADGTFVLDGLEPQRRYDVVVEGRGFARLRTLIAVPARGEAEPLELVLAPGLAVAARLVDGGGRPVQGATATLALVADPWDPSGMRSLGSGSSDSRGPHRAASDAEGRLRITGLAAGLYDLEVRAEGFLRLQRTGLEVAESRGAGGPAVDLGTLSLECGVDLVGRVVDPQGEPLADVDVVLAGPGLPHDRPHAASDEDGRFTLSGVASGASAGLSFQRRGFRRLELQVEPPFDAPVEAVLRPAAGVAGIVVGPGGDPLRDVPVQVFAERDGTTRQLPPSRLEIDLEPGTVRLTAHAEGLATAEPVEVRLGPGERRDGLRLVLSAAGMVEGRVTGPGGRPVVRAFVKALGGPRGSSLRALGLTGTDGRYRLGGLPVGRHTLRIRHPDHLPALRELEMGPAGRILDVRLEPGAEIHVRAVDAAGEPLSGAQVTLEGPSSGHRGPTAVDGRIRLRGLEPGDYRVKLTRPGFETVRSVEVEAAVGEEVEVELVMRRRSPAARRPPGRREIRLPRPPEPEEVPIVPPATAPPIPPPAIQP